MLPHYLLGELAPPFPLSQSIEFPKVGSLPRLPVLGSVTQARSGFADVDREKLKQ